MNLSTAMFLLNPSVRPVRVSYEDGALKNPDKHFKTLDPDLKKGDFVIVPTGTRWGFTVCKVEEVDFLVDYDSPTQYMWIAGKVDKSTYDALVEQEKIALERVSKAQNAQKRAELAAALRLSEVDVGDLDVVKSGRLLPATATPRGSDTPDGTQA